MTYDTEALVPLGTLFDIGAGKSVTPVARHGEPRYPFLRTSNIFWGRLELTNVDAMHFTREEIETKSLKKGDLLVCEGGDIGRAAIWNGAIERCGFQNHLHRLRPKSGEVVPHFYMYYLQAGFTQLGLYEGAANKTTIPNLSRNRLAALPVPPPSKREHSQLAALLFKLQKAVQLQAKIEWTVRALKATATQKLFSEGMRNEARKETEIGLIPQSWEVVELGLHLKAAQYGLSVKGQPSGRTPLLRMNCQVDGRVAFRDLQFVDLDQETLAKFRLADRDLLFNRTNSYELVGRTAIIHGNREAVCASYLIRLTLDHGTLYPEFINYFFNLDSTQAELRKLATRGVGQANINASKLRLFKIPKPRTIDEQREIVSNLQTLDAKIKHHENKRATLDSLFKTLLMKIMVGEIRVPVMDIDTSEVMVC